jgi:hypothetical protein
LLSPVNKVEIHDLRAGIPLLGMLTYHFASLSNPGQPQYGVRVQRYDFILILWSRDYHKFAQIQAWLVAPVDKPGAVPIYREKQRTVAQSGQAMRSAGLSGTRKGLLCKAGKACTIELQDPRIGVAVLAVF